MNELPLQVLAKTLQIEELLSKKQDNELFQEFAMYLEDLMQTNPNAIIAILYRIDVSEEKLKIALAENKNNRKVGEVIATLLIERQIDKIKFRQQYHKSEIEKTHKI